MRAALYARVSTLDGDQNPETQLRILREHAEARGWTVSGEYVDSASAADLRGRTAWRQVWNADAPSWHGRAGHGGGCARIRGRLDQDVLQHLDPPTDAHPDPAGRPELH